MKATRICTMPGCDRPLKSRGMCTAHYERLRLKGDVGTEPIGPRFGGNPTGERHHRWSGDAASYRAVHGRLKAARGRADAHACVECGRPAADWAYDYADEPLSSPHGPYSTDLTRYQPMCASCHTTHDYRKRV